MYLFLISILAGIVSGLLATWIFWYILYYVLSPKIEFSPSISKTKSESRGCGFQYRVKLHNSRKRIAVDAKLQAFVLIPGLTIKRTDDIFYIPLGTSRIMEILPKSYSGNVRKIIHLNLDKDHFTKIFQRNNFPDSIRTLAFEKKISLEDILSLDEEAYIKFVIKVADSVSGATKVFSSKKYFKRDVIYGYFKKDSLDVVPKKEDL